MLRESQISSVPFSFQQKTQGTAISEALAGLDFGTAVKDPRRFNYVCKVGGI